MKIKRTSAEKGKGCFWKIDEGSERLFEERGILGREKEIERTESGRWRDLRLAVIDLFSRPFPLRRFLLHFLPLHLLLPRLLQEWEPISRFHPASPSQ